MKVPDTGTQQVVTIIYLLIIANLPLWVSNLTDLTGCFKNHEKLAPGNWNPCTLLVGMYNGTAPVENSMAVPQKIKNRITYDPTIPLLSIYPKELKAASQRYLYTHIHRMIICNSQKVETTQVSISR